MNARDMNSVIPAPDLSHVTCVPLEYLPLSDRIFSNDIRNELIVWTTLGAEYSSASPAPRLLAFLTAIKDVIDTIVTCIVNI